MEGFSLVVVAAGRGERAGGDSPKQYRGLGGRMMWEWSALLAEKLFASGAVREAVFVVPAGDESFFSGRLLGYAFPFSVTAGGAERNDSVLNGLRCAKGDYVLVHDGARPFADEALCRRVMASVTEKKGIVPLLPVSDALKKEEEGILRPFPREGLFLTQTPQGFPREKLEQALRSHGKGARDEGEAWILAGYELGSVEGDRRNMKITWPGDFDLGESRFQKSFRTGIGYDIHPLVPGRRFILGGVLFPDFPLGFLGHSDGDPLVHALCDAILGGAGLGDIGTLYPASDMKYKGISSLVLLKDSARRASSEGWSLEWADCVVIAQEPRLSSRLQEMVKTMGNVLPSGWKNRVHLKAKSGEGEGAAGNCCSVICHAAATLSIRELKRDELQDED
jgi:2-C-methyl-D-erythritol 4-phosphate cytidylyltransferase/2-C-methyl-D-erythritol 2,4-cyclodiphosphate synthase